MTMPHLMNCEHSPNGWCLDCVAELHADAEKWRNVGAPIADEHRAKLEALSEAAEHAYQQMTKDAERYRWLREQSGTLKIGEPGAAGYLFAIAGEMNPMHGFLDAAIDAAIRSSKRRRA